VKLFFPELPCQQTRKNQYNKYCFTKRVLGLNFLSMPEIPNVEEQFRFKTKLHISTKLRTTNLQHSINAGEIYNRHKTGETQIKTNKLK